ncbi:MAG: hypothetical protein KC636_20280, partial [Myxococcales bacterium]|nr:hypothetical protein [Myxococcales bacterium]
CGDGNVYEGVEECDDGNGDETDMCTTLCAAPSCVDALQSGAETDVDCGGPDCDGCLLGQGCTDGGDCGEGLCIDAACKVPETCAEILAADPMAPSGAYTIAGDGQVADFGVYCDMTTDGGGWTIVWATSGGDNQQPITGDAPVAGDPLAFAPFNLTRAQKVVVAGRTGEGIFRRSSGQWIKVDSALYDDQLNQNLKRWTQSVTITANDNTSVMGWIGYANYSHAGGGDYNVTMVDGPTCNGVTMMGVDLHSSNYLHLNCGCQRHYLYSYSANTLDGDGSYKVNTALGSWPVTATCTTSEGGGLALLAAMR